MQRKIPDILNHWLEKKLSYPGCTDRQLRSLITGFEENIFLVTGSVLIYAIPLSIFAPQATLYINYMIAFSGLFALSLVLTFIFPRHHVGVHAFIGTVMHLMTFYTIIKLGGIATSGGLIYAGIANVLATLPRQKTWLPVSMFSLFCILVVLLEVLKPWLHVPDQMTPSLNSFLWMSQSIIIIGAELGFVLRFFGQQRKLEEVEARHMKEINEFKDRFYTNITHEFRTPLTIIKGMTTLIKVQPEQWIESGLQKIESNSNILLNLVNQMLNLAKAEEGALSVYLVRRDVNQYLAYLVEQFSSEAQRRKIDLKFKTAGEQFEMDFDPEKLMHIITNLISNALKYTQENGRIEVATGVMDNGKTFFILVRDTGTGIEKEHLGHLFDRFYTAEHQLTLGGTGIGLALTKEMVQLLQGTISVESIKGEGSEFKVILPVTRKARLSDSPEVADLFEVSVGHYENVRPYGEPPYIGQSTEELLSVRSILPAKLPLLLIVEDSPDVVLYLESILKYEYRIEVAVNGSIGLDKALEIMPDIILSDVMMPVMDGIGLLEKVKNDIRTSHIPVILLTAKADIESRLAGLERGANSYLAKPVDERELHFQLKNLVELKKKLFERYRSLEKYPETSDIDIKREDEFMIKVRQVLETNIDDDEFGIAKLCREMALSRSQMYKKFKSLSNITLADYFKSLRLHKAKELLLTTNLNVTQVSFAAGFKSLSYLSREFAREFGKSPSDFRKNSGILESK